MLILVSAGHSTVPPKDPGACSGGVQEAAIAVEMRDRVAKILRDDYRLNVIEDGADGINEPLKKALLLARKSNIAVEFHMNGNDNPQASGVECLSKPARRALAEDISAAIVAVTGSRLRGARGWLNQNGGQHHRLAFCQAGGVIVELGFISNRAELDQILAKRAEIAEAIAAVIAEHAGRKKVSPKPVPVVGSFDPAVVHSAARAASLPDNQNMPGSDPDSSSQKPQPHANTSDAGQDNSTPSAAGDSAAAPARSIFKVEDWKPFALKWLKRIWGGFSGVNFTQLPANFYAAATAGENWWIWVVVAIVLVILTGLICFALSLGVGGLWLWNRREIGKYKILEQQTRNDPSLFNFGLDFVEKVSILK